MHPSYKHSSELQYWTIWSEVTFSAHATAHPSN
jgi:hypothetical protein